MLIYIIRRADAALGCGAAIEQHLLGHHVGLQCKTRYERCGPRCTDSRILAVLVLNISRI